MDVAGGAASAPRAFSLPSNPIDHVEKNQVFPRTAKVLARRMPIFIITQFFSWQIGG